MKLAFCLFNYFPYGGLQRNMLAIAQAAVARGYHVTIFTGRWQGEIPPGIAVKILPARGWSHAAATRRFIRLLKPALEAGNYDLVVGFNKMPGLDCYYAADSCFAHKAFAERGWLYRQAPRSRVYLECEAAVFGRQSHTTILEVSTAERARFVDFYHTPATRFQTLTPGISRNRAAPPNYREVRQRARAALGIHEGQAVMLALGSGFRTKGLDRSLRILALLITQQRPKERPINPLLLVVGQDSSRRFQRQARSLGVSEYVRFLGGREDVPELLQAGDLLLHPAYKENTGNVLLEAMIAGLPVVATDVCGYARYIEEAQMGQVIGPPYRMEEFAETVAELLHTPREVWHARGRAFADTADIYSRPQRALDIMEQVWKAKAQGKAPAAARANV